jgi:hypothetical protein
VECSVLRKCWGHCRKRRGTSGGTSEARSLEKSKALNTIVTPSHHHSARAVPNPAAEDNALRRKKSKTANFSLRLTRRNASQAAWRLRYTTAAPSRATTLPDRSSTSITLHYPRYILRAMSSAATPSIPIGSMTPAAPSQPAVPGLPPPSTFDILPDLHKILSRLIAASTQPAAATPTPGQVSADGPLEIQQVAAAATEVKLKLQRARTAVMALPEIDRTCEDQQEEIEYLEGRISRLKASLQQLGQPSPEAGDDDQSMTG